MNVVSSVFENDQQLVSYFTNIMMASFYDYPESMSLCKSAIKDMKELVGDKPITTLCSALTKQIASDIRFAFASGFKANLEYFRNPIANRFLQTGFEDFLREDVMAQMPYRKEAEIMEQRIIATFSNELKLLYESVREHHIYHETACPKLAHYLGYRLANQYLPAVEPGYVKDVVMTMAYERLMRQYFGCEIIIRSHC